jgi:peptide/nickel transport system substrate-binding protein
LKIRYDPQFALKTIRDNLERQGAKLDANNRWVYDNKPIVVKILIRNDDLIRKTFGDLVSSEIEKIGFSVVKEYGDLIKANQIIYGSNPMDLDWNLYTESFISSAFLRYDPSSVTQMYAPWFGSMPGSQNPAYWQYANSTIDYTTQKLIFNNYTTEQQRNDLLRHAESMGIQEAVRLFFARSQDPYITSKKVDGLINDYSAGIANKLSFINAKKSGLNNNTLDVGMKQIYQGAWNNVNGCSDFFCRQIYSLVTDAAIFLNPYSGDPMPFRNNWTKIVSDGPYNKIVIPKNAINWNPYTQEWTSSNNNSDAVAMTGITMKPLFSKWHNGITVDKFDLMYSYYFPFEWAIDTKNNDLTFDAEYSSTVLPTLPLTKGITFNNNITVTSYVDLWHFDPKQIPQYGSLWASEPWEITAAAERLVKTGKFSFSKADANVKQNEQLSLIVPSHSNLIRQELEKMIQEKYIPNSLKGQITLDYAINRYDSSIKWINQHQHAIIGNGPFYLDSYNPTGGIIVLKKYVDESYPFKKGSFSIFENPKSIQINKINVPKFLKIDTIFKFDIEFKQGNNNTNQFEGVINYFISDRNNEIVVNGTIEKSRDDYGKSITALDSKNNQIENALQKVVVDIPPNQTSILHPGPAKLKIFISSEDSLRPLIYEQTLIVRR